MGKVLSKMELDSIINRLHERDRGAVTILDVEAHEIAQAFSQARRYRWLRDGKSKTIICRKIKHGFSGAYWEIIDPDKFDAEIDADSDAAGVLARAVEMKKEAQ